ncbi:MAG: hypothetical protein PVH88_22400 [Ignavibacteria bacterium]|jgi:hypothetical protein
MTIFLFCRNSNIYNSLVGNNDETSDNQTSNSNNGSSTPNINPFLIAVLMLTFDIPTALIGLWLSSLIAVPGFYLLKKISKHNIRYEKIPFGLFLGLGYGFIALVLRDILPFFHIFESF